MLTRYQEPLKLKAWGIGYRQTIHHAQGADRARTAPRHHYARDAQTRHRVQAGLVELHSAR